MKPESPFMTRAEAAEWLRVSIETVDREAIRRGWRTYMRGRYVLLNREDVEASVKPKNKEIPNEQTQENQAQVNAGSLQKAWSARPFPSGRRALSQAGLHA